MAKETTTKKILIGVATALIVTAIIGIFTGGFKVVKYFVEKDLRDSINALKTETKVSTYFLGFSNDFNDLKSEVKYLTKKVDNVEKNTIKLCFKHNFQYETSLNPVESTKEQYQTFNDSIYNFAVNTNVDYKTTARVKKEYLEAQENNRLNKEIKIVNKQGTSPSIVRTIEGKLTINNN